MAGEAGGIGGAGGGLGVMTSPNEARAKLVALAERFLQRQLDLVGGVIEEVTLRNALYRMGIDWKWAAEVLDRREFAAMYEQTARGPVRLVGWWEAVRARLRGPVRRPLRVSQPYEPGRKRRRPSVWSMTPLKRVFLAILELARNVPVFGKCDWLPEHNWSEKMLQPVRTRRKPVAPDVPPWQQWMQEETYSVRLIQEYNDAFEELWGYDPVLMRELEGIVCRPLRFTDPAVWLQGAWLE
jgi:hypothetical protein